MERKLPGKKFRKFGYTSRNLSSLLKILEHAVPFATGSWQKFKVDGLVEWKEPPKLYYNWLNNHAGRSLNWGTRSVGIPHIPPGHAENVRKCNVANLGFCACFPQGEYHIKGNIQPTCSLLHKPCSLLLLFLICTNDLINKTKEQI